MQDSERAPIRNAAEREAIAAARSLAAAERAVIEGRLNAAKVLRAAALSSRQRALLLFRAAGGEDALGSALSEAAAAARATLAALDRTEDPALAAALRSAGSITPLLDRTSGALAGGSDVSETDIAQMIFVCEECGYALEAQRAEVCPSCGSLAGEFALFAPFFASTQEHIARRTPADALAQLRGDAQRLAETLAGDDAALRRTPAAGEWCAKEIAGHMVDIVELAARRLRAAVDPAYEPPRERTALPWKLLDTEDYPNADAAAIAARFAAGLDALCALFDELDDAAWRAKVDLVSGRTLAVDVASWVANHNVAHLAQMRRLLRAS